MSIVINTKMPINCVECHSMGIRNLNDCQLIFIGCANCGRHPHCPLVDLDDIKEDIKAEPMLLDTWQIKGKEAELWIVKGKLQIRAFGTIHNSVTLGEIIDRKVNEIKGDKE